MPSFKKSRGFTLKSGNNSPFKQLGSAPMTRGQAARLSEKYGDARMPGESRFQMHQRLRRASKTEAQSALAPEETYLGKHLQKEKTERTERREAGRVKRQEFVEGAKEFGKGLMDIPGKIIGHVRDIAEDVGSNVGSSNSNNRNRGGANIQTGSDSWGTYERRTASDGSTTYWYKEGGEGEWKQQTDEDGMQSIEDNIEFE